jgi:hypothetical protein
LSFDQALSSWHSYTPSSHITLSPSVEDSIRFFFLTLEKVHGHVLISHALGYITCAGPAGITQAELEDVLSCDDDVLDDVYQWWVPPSRRLPPLLWARARSDIGAYLVEKGAADNSGARVYSWYHRQFWEVAERMYVPADTADANNDQNRVFQGKNSIRTARHRMLAMYFGNALFGGVKHTTAKSTDPDVVHDRSVRAMRLLLHDGLDSDDPSNLDNSADSFFSGRSARSIRPIANTRRLMQQVYHECRAGLVSSLKNSMGALDFIIAKTSFASLVQSMRQDIVDTQRMVQELEISNDVDASQVEDIEHVKSMLRFVQRHIGDCSIAGMSWAQVARDEPDNESYVKFALTMFERKYGCAEARSHNPSFYHEACMASVAQLQPWCKPASVSPCYMTIQANSEYVYSLTLALDGAMIISIGSGQSSGSVVEMWNTSSGENMRKLTDTRFFSCSEDGKTAVFVQTDPNPGEDTEYSTPHSRISVYHLASWKLVFSVRIKISTYDRTEDNVMLNATGSLLLVLLKQSSLGASETTDKVMLWDIKSRVFIGTINAKIPFHSFHPLLNTAGNLVIIATPDKHTAQAYKLNIDGCSTSPTDSSAVIDTCASLPTAWEFFVGSRGNDIRQASFSNDQALVAFSQDDNIFFVDVASGALKAIVPFGNLPIYHAPGNVIFVGMKSDYRGKDKRNIISFPVSEFIGRVEELQLGAAQKGLILPREKSAATVAATPYSDEHTEAQVAVEKMKEQQARLRDLVKDMTHILVAGEAALDIRNMLLSSDGKILVVGTTSELFGWHVPSGEKCIYWTGSFYSGMVITSNMAIIANSDNLIHFYEDKRLLSATDGHVSTYKEASWGSHYNTFKVCRKDIHTPMIVTLTSEDVCCIHDQPSADPPDKPKPSKFKSALYSGSDSDSDDGFNYGYSSYGQSKPTKCQVGLIFYNLLSGAKMLQGVCVPNLSNSRNDMTFDAQLTTLYISGRDQNYEDCLLKYDLRSALARDANSTDPPPNYVLEKYPCPSLDTKDCPVLCLSADNNVLGAGIGHDILLFDTSESPLSPRLTFSGHISFIMDIVMSSTGHVVVSTAGAQDPRRTVTGRGDDYFRTSHIIWDGLTGKIARKVTGRSSSANVALTAAGELLARYSYDKLVVVEEAISGAVVWTLREGLDNVRVGCRLAFGCDDNMLVGTFENDASHVWDVKSGALKRTLMTGSAQVGVLECTDNESGARRAVIYARGEGLQVWSIDHP